MRNEFTYEKQNELEEKIRKIIRPYVLETTTLGELDDLEAGLTRQVRHWNKSIERRCEFCYGVLDCGSDHK